MLFWAEGSLSGSIGADSVISYDCVLVRMDRMRCFRR